MVARTPRDFQKAVATSDKRFGQGKPSTMKSDLTFITNEHDVNLEERLKVLIVPQTRLFDCLVGYFYLSGPSSTS